MFSIDEDPNESLLNKLFYYRHQGLSYKNNNTTLMTTPMSHSLKVTYEQVFLLKTPRPEFAAVAGPSWL